MQFFTPTDVHGIAEFAKLVAVKRLDRFHDATEIDGILLTITRLYHIPDLILADVFVPKRRIRRNEVAHQSDALTVFEIDEFDAMATKKLG